MSLADELLADLEEGGDPEVEEVEDVKEDAMEEETVKVDIKIDSIRHVAKLNDSEQVC